MATTIMKSTPNGVTRLSSNSTAANGRSVGSAINSGVSSAASTVSDFADTIAESVNSFISSAASTATDLATDAKNAMSGKLTDITSSVTTFADQVTSVKLPTEELGGLVDSTFKGAQETISKVLSLGSDSSEALANPVAFVSKPADDVVEGNDSSIFGDIADGIGEFIDDLELEKLSESVDTITSTFDEVVDTAKDTYNQAKAAYDDVKSAVDSVVSDVKGAIDTVTDSYKQCYEHCQQQIQNVKKDVIEPIKTGINDTVSTIKEGVGGIMDYATDIASDTVGTFVDMGQDVQDAVGDLIDIVPDKYKDKLQKYNTNFAADLIDKYVDDHSKTIDKLKNTVAKTGIDTELTTFLKNISIGNYPAVTDSDGNEKIGFGNSRITFDQVNATYKAAQTIIPSITIDGDVISYKNNKDFYDILVQYSASNGYADLLKQLKNQPEAQKYIDSRTIQLLQVQTVSCVEKGDIETFEAIVDFVGVDKAGCDRADMLLLLMNGPYSRERAVKIQELSKKLFGIEMEQPPSTYSSDTTEDTQWVRHATSVEVMEGVYVTDAGALSILQTNGNATDPLFVDAFGADGADFAKLCSASMMTYGYV